MRLDTVLLVGLAAVALYLVMKPKAPQVVTVTQPAPAPQQSSPTQTAARDDVFQEVLAGINAALDGAGKFVNTITSTQQTKPAT